ncbi:hypothetical protein C8P68_105407 [Mucilaginibacter yixingensis]|uniref:VanZ family protein n=1 Tax=Mucilaginibacter yixingensis TaxID=1295612 RepID=A0A2T5J8W6_9SPHI|nr:VanZ family protein [Mucilaginibacter yixingensis]PTQ95896.1 hypothetical protein C8P68_105407 [Mucilaginibacter yixingensis]
MKAFLKYQGPAVLWALFILVMCSVSLGTVGDSHLFFTGFDKVTHCGLFFVMVVWITKGMIRKNGALQINYSQAAIALLLSVAYGGAIELAQAFIFTWRDGDWGDMASDVIGASMATFCILVTLYRPKR